MLEKIKQQIPPLIDFVKKHRLFLSITIVVVILLSAIFIAIPVINVNGLKLVNQGVSVRIEPGQTVRLKGGDVLLRIQRFINDSCPQDQKCFGSQQITGVMYDTQINGHRLNTYSFSKIPDSNYQIETLSSDYKTYAEIMIVGSR